MPTVLPNVLCSRMYRRSSRSVNWYVVRVRKILTSTHLGRSGRIDELAEDAGQVRAQARRWPAADQEVAGRRLAEDRALVGAGRQRVRESVVAVENALAPVEAPDQRQAPRADDAGEPVPSFLEVDLLEALEVAAHVAGQRDVAPEREAGHALNLLVLQHASMIVEPQVVHRRSPREERRLGPPAVPHVRGCLAQIPAGQKAGFRPELGIDAAVGGAVAQIAPLAREIRFERGPLKKTVFLAARLRPDAMKLKRCVRPSRNLPSTPPTRL